jgi:hypothetical protein
MTSSTSEHAPKLRVCVAQSLQRRPSRRLGAQSAFHRVRLAVLSEFAKISTEWQPTIFTRTQTIWFARIVIFLAWAMQAAMS